MLSHTRRVLVNFLYSQKNQLKSIHLSSRLFDNNIPCSIDPSHGLNSDQIEIQSMATKFASEQMKPLMAEWDKNEIFPVDVMKNAAQLGFAAIYCKPQYGGTG